MHEINKSLEKNTICHAPASDSLIPAISPLKQHQPTKQALFYSQVTADAARETQVKQGLLVLASPFGHSHIVWLQI